MTDPWAQPPGGDQYPPPPPPGPPPGYGPPPGAPGYPGAPQPAYGAGYGVPYYGTPQPTTNTLAIISLVAGVLGCFAGVGWIAAIVCGFIARRQIRESGGTQTGQGMATAGIVLGFVWVGLFVAYIIFVAAVIGFGSSVDSTSLAARF